MPGISHEGDPSEIRRKLGWKGWASLRRKPRIEQMMHRLRFKMLFSLGGREEERAAIKFPPLCRPRSPQPRRSAGGPTEFC